jgi:hypothetical protein
MDGRRRRMPRCALKLKFKRKQPVEQPKKENMVQSEAGKHEAMRREVGRK